MRNARNKLGLILKNNWIFLLLVILSLLIRFYFLDKYITVSGDLLLYSDWGEKFWDYGGRNFYFVKDWYYAQPNYPPLINLYYAVSFKIFDNRYLFAALHNLIKIPPAFFIIYYYKYGYFVNLKLLAILSDILIGIFIYKFISNKFKKRTPALLASALFLLNPVTVLLSAIWGQTDSVIALLSVIAFYLLTKKRFVISALLFSSGLLFKPNWAIFIPVYVLLFFLYKPKIKSLVLSFLSVLALLFFSSYPFTNNPLVFYPWLIKTRLIPTFGASKVASVSAFNFYTTFLRIDYHLSSFRIFFVPVKYLGQFVFSLIYIFVFVFLWKKDKTFEGILKVLVTLGLGSFIFMPGMLERYFFPALFPLAILSVFNKKNVLMYIFLSLSFSLNMIWALFRRSNGVIDTLLTGNNFMLLRFLSVFNVISYFYLIWLLFRDNLLKLSLWKKQVNISIRRLRSILKT